MIRVLPLQPELLCLGKEGSKLDVSPTEVEVVDETTSKGVGETNAHIPARRTRLPQKFTGALLPTGQPDARGCSLQITEALEAILGCESAPWHIMFHDICKVWVLLPSCVFWNATLISVYLV